MAAPRIDLSRIIPIGPDARNKRQQARRVALAVQAHWKALAGLLLGSTAGVYKRGIIIEQADERGVRVVLTGVLANIREQGMGPGGIGTSGPYDVRQFLLRSTTKSIRQGADGSLYVNVPFSHTMGAVRAAGGSAAVRAVRDLTPTLSTGGAMRQGATIWGERLSGAHGARLAGAVRLQKTYAAATQSQVRTWRTASWKGSPWMHPGVEARHLAAHVRRDMGTILAGVL